MAILTTIVHKRKMSLKLKVWTFWILKILKSQSETFLDKYPYSFILFSVVRPLNYYLEAMWYVYVSIAHL